MELFIHNRWYWYSTSYTMLLLQNQSEVLTTHFGILSIMSFFPTQEELQSNAALRIPISPSFLL